jgi:hypothetical protein
MEAWKHQAARDVLPFGAVCRYACSPPARRRLPDATLSSRAVLARLWKAHAQELCEMCLADPEPEESAIPCACCDKPADSIGEHGLTVCARCAADPWRERDVILDGPGGLRELRELYGAGPTPDYAWLLLSGRALTVDAAQRLANERELTSIIGIGPKRAARIDEAPRNHRERGES